jgi:type IV pilus assembly protein PilY1
MSNGIDHLHATRVARTLALALATLLPAGGAWALSTDIANEPLINKANAKAVAKPNVLFILDDSGSMASGAMPDDMNDNSRYGYYSWHCNGVGFDPAQTYDPPIRADGTLYPNATMTGAWDDGYIRSTGGTSRSSTTSVAVGTGSKSFVISTTSGSASSFYTVGQRLQLTSSSDTNVQMVGTVTSWTNTSSGKWTLVMSVDYAYGTGTLAAWTITNMVNITSGNSDYYVYEGTEPKLNWQYTATNYVNNTFAQECLTSIPGDRSGNAKFTRTIVGTSSAATTQKNYANWYSYYRTRRLTMRWAAGSAFQGLSSSYRVGFTTISDRTAVDGNKFLHVKDYDSTQKVSFFNKLYTTTGSSSTPLRGAISKAGRYYAYKVSGQDYDPMQYSCQRNYSILSTDGYWNTGLEKTDGDATTNYGPFMLDNTTLVGQQDSSATEIRPMQDGQKTVVTTTSSYSDKQTRDATTPKTIRTPWTKVTYSGGVTTGCIGGRKKYTITTQTANTYVYQNSIQGQERTGTYTGTQVTTDGTAAAETYGSTTWGSWANVGAANLVTTGSDPTPPTYPAGSTSTSSCVTTQPANTETAGTAVTTNGTVTYSTVIDNITKTSSTKVTTYPGGSTNSLADVAEYYYVTDLRDDSLSNCTSKSSGENVCSNSTSDDVLNKQQHMKTYTIGLGVPGTLVYNDANKAALAAGTVDWPVPTADEATAIDDLWHAAVNGRGSYFSALNASQLSQAIKGALSEVQSQSAAGSASATSATQLLDGVNNYKFKAEYRTVSWVGDVKAYLVDPKTGEAAAGASWSAQTKLNAMNPDQRNIYYASASSTATSKMKSFTYANLTSDGLGGYFSNFCSSSNIVIPDQCANMTAANLTIANNGTNLVNWLRGTSTYESTGVYRTRVAKLGDIIGGAPVSVAAPPFVYEDEGYATFKSDNASRKPMTYAAANDGMLHAFSADTSDGGTEMWAYVPQAVMANMYRLADTGYGTKHIYMVDGAPNFGDIYAANKWRTIVVGGLAGGGRAYYALDVTDPVNPKALWEISNTTPGFANLGYTFGNPVITKINKRWVVVFASGYNNVDGNADGKGHVYVVDAYTGVKLSEVTAVATVTTVDSGGNSTTTQAAGNFGSTSDPAGLTKLNAWIEKETDNTATRFYAGDLLGNLWRFNFADAGGAIDTATGSAYVYSGKAVQLASFVVTSGSTKVGQPITMRVEPMVVRTNDGKSYDVVVAGTGRYLGVADLADKTQQSLYAIKDEGKDTGWGDVRASGKMVAQTMTTGGPYDGNGDKDYDDVGDFLVTRVGTSKSVNWISDIGWMIDFPIAGERVVTKMLHQFNTLVVPTAIPEGDACASTGSSYLYYLNINDGSPLLSGGVAGFQFSKDSIIVGVTWVQTSGTKDSSGKVVTTSKLIVNDSKGNDVTLSPPGGTGGGGETGTLGTLRRTSWRELVN